MLLNSIVTAQQEHGSAQIRKRPRTPKRTWAISSPFPPGSSGNPHRGPDRTLRINAVRGLILQALAAPQARLVKVEGKKRRVTVEVPMAMCDDIVAGLQLVARLGAQGHCLPVFLRMTFGLHQAMQAAREERQRPRRAQGGDLRHGAA